MTLRSMAGPLLVNADQRADKRNSRLFNGSEPLQTFWCLAWHEVVVGAKHCPTACLVLMTELAETLIFFQLRVEAIFLACLLYPPYAADDL